MNRREAIRRVGLLLGGTVSASVVSGVLSGCAPRSSDAYTPQALTAEQYALAGAAADIILPATDTPGARDVGVPAFIDGIVGGAYTEAERTRFVAGLDDLERRARAAGGPFADAPAERQAALLQALAGEASAARDAGETPFFFMLKELTLVGYYTSEVGATKELQWVHAAGRYDGDVPLAEAGRAYA